jgi:hypothetical protein
VQDNTGISLSDDKAVEWLTGRSVERVEIVRDEPGSGDSGYIVMTLQGGFTLYADAPTVYGRAGTLLGDRSC